MPSNTEKHKPLREKIKNKKDLNGSAVEKLAEQVTAVQEKLVETNENIPKKRHWLVNGLLFFVSRPVALSVMFIGGIAGTIGGIVVIQLGIDKKISVKDFEDNRAESESCIYSAVGKKTAALDLGVLFSRSLDKKGIYNVHSCGPTAGAEMNVDNLLLPGAEQYFAVSQKDLSVHFKATGVNHSVVLIETDNPECLFIPTSRKEFNRLADIRSYLEAQEKKREEGQEFVKLKVALALDGSGSQYTARTVINRALPYPDVMDIRILDGAPSISAAVHHAVEGWQADIGFFVEHPAPAQADLRHGLKSIYDLNLPLVAIEKSEYDQNFKALPQEYNLIQTTIHKEKPQDWSVVKWGKYFMKDNAAPLLPSMLCTTMNIHARNPEPIENLALSNYVSFLNKRIAAKTNKDDLRISHSTKFEVLASPTSP